MNWDASLVVTGFIFTSLIAIVLKNCYNAVLDRIRNNNNDQRIIIQRLENLCLDLDATNADVCAICLECFQYKISTNCSHRFCGNCFLSYWHVGNFVRSVTCPMCRSEVHDLTKEYNENEQETSSDYKKRIDDEINYFNRLYSYAPRTWAQKFMDLPLIMRHIAHYLMNETNAINIIHRMRVLVLISIIIGYCLSPFDVFPEAGFGILGILDDVLILATFITYLMIFVRRTVGGGDADFN